MKPLCWKCKKPVEEFYEELSDYCFEITYIAVCHGAVDRMTLTGGMQFLLRTGSDRILDFVAFRDKPMIEEGKEKKE